MESTSKEIILITGITGFIGSWIGKVFSENALGEFRIRASVRSIKKTEVLRKEYGDELFNQLEFVEADLNNKESLFKAVEGVKYIIHVASPIPGAINVSGEEMLRGARDGMNTIIEAALQNKVKRIVITSSFSTILGDHWRRSERDHIYTEEDFAPMTTPDGYARSKITQETIAREFLKNQKPGEDGYMLEMLTIHPTFVIGPTLIPERNSTVEAIAKIVNRQIPGIPNFQHPFVDVRDVAMAHYLAFKTPGISGGRFIIDMAPINMQEVADILHNELRQYGYRCQNRRIGYCPIKIASWFDPQVKIILPWINGNIRSTNQKSIDILGMQYTRDLKQTVIDTGYSLIDKGLVPDKRKK
ncbi:nad-dependent epimerase dehydratase [Stylonychia lemnae]|uniref:Nad-dependent epimerase dehydratase n=1 Tax=Stylonychia lemnae TaxID=5949 RepID=A0A078AG42_STYLE|nr:nad-dependent epimerase dehydratase [Stylonychia lemnae]|eukprot:CDW80432.1 nad-dependent epimerase dehydratase [Stylonychia lemnae]